MNDGTHCHPGLSWFRVDPALSVNLFSVEILFGNQIRNVFKVCKLASFKTFCLLFVNPRYPVEVVVDSSAAALVVVVLQSSTSPVKFDAADDK